MLSPGPAKYAAWWDLLSCYTLEVTKDVFGKTIRYKTKSLGDEHDGLYFPASKRIEIDSKLKGDARTVTVLHEELHAIFDVLGFSSPEVMSSVLEELVVDNVSRWIVDNYKLTEK